MASHPQRSGLCVASCILGLLGLLTCGLTSIPAIICSYMGRARVEASRGALYGKDLAESGVHLGYAGLVLSLVLAPLILIFASTGFTDQVPAERNRTVSLHAAIRTGLEEYREKFGEYPSPARGSVQANVAGQNWDVSSSLMLYQALRGDGDDMIRSSGSSTNSSDGIVSEAERKNQLDSNDLPKSAVFKTSAGYILVDGYGHPFQYTIGGAESVNPAYDLWSFGKAPPPSRIDKAAKQDEEITAGWIKNW
jgi:hypothetical protein